MNEIKVICDELDYNLIDFCAYDEEDNLLGYMVVRLNPYENVIEKLVVESDTGFKAIVEKLLDSLMYSQNNDDLYMSVPSSFVFPEDEVGSEILELLDNRADSIVSYVGTKYSAACSEFLEAPRIRQYLTKNKQVNSAVSIRDLSESQQKEVCKLLTDKMISPVDSSRDLRNQYGDSHSLVLIHNEHVTGCILMSEEEPQVVTLDAVCVEKNSMDTITLFIQAALEAVERDPQVVFTTLAVNDVSRQLIDKLFEHTTNKLVSSVYEAHFLSLPRGRS